MTCNTQTKEKDMQIRNTSGEYWTGECWGVSEAAEEYDCFADLPQNLETNCGDEMSSYGDDGDRTWETDDGSVQAGLIFGRNGFHFGSGRTVPRGDHHW